MKMSMLPTGFPKGSGNRWKEVCKNKSNDLEVFLRLLRIVGTQGESMRAMSKTVLAVALLATSAFFCRFGFGDDDSFGFWLRHRRIH